MRPTAPERPIEGRIKAPFGTQNTLKTQTLEAFPRSVNEVEALGVANARPQATLGSFEKTTASVKRKIADAVVLCHTLATGVDAVLQAFLEKSIDDLRAFQHRLVHTLVNYGSGTSVTALLPVITRENAL